VGEVQTIGHRSGTGVSSNLGLSAWLSLDPVMREIPKRHRDCATAHAGPDGDPHITRNLDTPESESSSIKGNHNGKEMKRSKRILQNDGWNKTKESIYSHHNHSRNISPSSL
jgi:hypothetical protein